jgi:hypothetical protein
MPFLYGILFLFSFYIIFIIFLRVRHPYWSKQPVYHSHKLIYKFYHPGIIKTLPSEKDRYVDLKSIEFKNINSEETNKKISTFLCENYVNDSYSIFKPAYSDIKCFYEPTNNNSYVSFMNHNSIQYINNKQVEEKQITIGMITTRPLTIIIDKKHINVDLVDLLCINPDYRKNYNVPKLIQTHKYNIEQLSKKAHIYLFKNENNNSFNIVPLCRFDCYGFDIFTWKTPKHLGQEKLLEITDNTLDMIIDTIMLSKFKNKIYFDIFTMRSLINNGNIHIYCLKLPNKILGIYIFKKSCASYNNENVFECICSINLCKKEFFLNGFHHASHACCSKYHYRYLVIENTSNNNIIINKILSSKSYISKYSVSYYTYNYITREINPQETIIIV